jgi:hypothetical protein
MIRVAFPRLGIANSFLFIGIIGIEGIAVGINELDIVVELCYRCGSAGVGGEGGGSENVLTPAFVNSIHDCGRSSV